MITKESWGTVKETEVFLYRLSNSKGDEVCISNYGGIITSWSVADRNGKRTNIVIGFKHLEHYLPNNPNFGALVGRYANRIAGGHFSIDGIPYQLGLNEGPNQLHGGYDNFTKAIWEAKIGADFNTLILCHESKDGHEGFPGNVKVQVHFHLSEENELRLYYEAVTDKATHINLTSHPYFNLSGDFDKGILQHELRIQAGTYTPVDKTGIPTGALASVTGTAYDFRQQKVIGRDIQSIGGYDHNFVLDGPANKIILAAMLCDPESGRILEVYTDQPGLQFYTSNALDGTDITDDGIALKAYAAVCLETQHFPDSPNHKNFPLTLLRPGELFQSTTCYKVSLL